MTPPGATHDPQLRSWVDSANDPTADFPIQNLPLGVFRAESGRHNIGIAIGDQILNLQATAAAGLIDHLDPLITSACRRPTVNALMALDVHAMPALRRALSLLLQHDSPPHPELLVPSAAVEMQLPADIGDYTDFYASIHHATNVGRLFRPDNPLLPNYKYLPIGYHGRASSIVPSGTPVHRPHGQLRPDPNQSPQFGPSRLLDYELEVGFFLGPGNELGSPIPIDEAGRHLFGACLVNDWSARDIQSWEYQPLGPFLAKSFATTISPWVVTMEALVPFRIAAARRPEGDPDPLPYLHSSADQAAGGIDLTLEVYLKTPRMSEPVRLSRASFESMYWTPAQMVAHHSSNGCNLRPGDLIASGTVSGPGDGERGSLLELTARGTQPLQLPSGETRKFLEEGDEIIFRGYCRREGYVRIGFGECHGQVMSPIVMNS